MGFDILSDGQAIMESSSSELERSMGLAFDSRRRVFGDELLCYSPTAYPYKISDHKQSSLHNFISISVTGTSCSLECDHCDGHLLKAMKPALTPEALVKRCQEVEARGAEGVLISGGSDSKGHVPLDRFGEAIKTIKTELGLKVVVHTSLVTEKTAQLLKEAGIDAAMLDIIGNEQVARSVYHIEDGPRRMNASLSILRESGIPTVPHILVGINYGKIGGELEAMQMIAQNDPAAVVVIVLNPVRRTPMESINPPAPEAIGRVITVARHAMEKTPILLGCARPMGQHKVDSDKYAVMSGANGIAYISQAGVDFAKERGLEPVFSDICCSLAYQMFM